MPYKQIEEKYAKGVPESEINRDAFENVSSKKLESLHHEQAGSGSVGRSQHSSRNPSNSLTSQILEDFEFQNGIYPLSIPTHPLRISVMNIYTKIKAWSV